MNNLSIGQKFGLVFSLLIAQILGFSWIANKELNSIASDNKTSLKNGVTPILLISNMGVEIQRARINLRDTLLATENGYDQSGIQKFRDNYLNLADTVNKEFDQLKPFFSTPEELMVINEFNTSWNNLLGVIKQIEQATKQNDFKQARELMLTKCYEIGQSVGKALIDLQKSKEKALDKTAVDGLQTAHDVSMKLMALSIVGLLVSLSLAA